MANVKVVTKSHIDGLVTTFYFISVSDRRDMFSPFHVTVVLNAVHKKTPAEAMSLAGVLNIIDRVRLRCNRLQRGVKPLLLQ